MQMVSQCFSDLNNVTNSFTNIMNQVQQNITINKNLILDAKESLNTLIENNANGISLMEVSYFNKKLYLI